MKVNCLNGLVVAVTAFIVYSCGDSSGSREYTLKGTGISIPGIAECEIRALEVGNREIGSTVLKDIPIDAKILPSDSLGCMQADSSGSIYRRSFLATFAADPDARYVRVYVAFEGYRPVMLEDSIKLRSNGENSIDVYLLSSVKDGGFLMDYAPPAVLAEAFRSVQKDGKVGKAAASACCDIRDLSTELLTYVGGARGQRLRLSLLPVACSAGHPDWYGMDGYAIAEILDYDGNVDKRIEQYYKLGADYIELYLKDDLCIHPVQRLDFHSGGVALLFNLVSDECGFLCSLNRLGWCEP